MFLLFQSAHSQVRDLSSLIPVGMLRGPSSKERAQQHVSVLYEGGWMWKGLTEQLAKPYQSWLLHNSLRGEQWLQHPKTFFQLTKTKNAKESVLSSYKFLLVPVSLVPGKGFWFQMVPLSTHVQGQKAWASQEDRKMYPCHLENDSPLREPFYGQRGRTEKGQTRVQAI